MVLHFSAPEQRDKELVAKAFQVSRSRRSRESRRPVTALCPQVVAPYHRSHRNFSTNALLRGQKGFMGIV
jgi:hypothetical protein